MTSASSKARFVRSVLLFLILCGAWFRIALAGGAFRLGGWDFAQFYIAGNISPHSLYDQVAYQEYGRRTLGAMGVKYYAPYVRPAVFTLPLRLVMWLPYRVAFAVWAAIQFGCYLAALYLLFRRFGLDIKYLAGFGLFYPSLFGIIVGQDGNAVALLLLIGFLLLVDGKETAAGLVLACCLYKFNIVLLVPVLLLFHKKYHALAVFAAAGAALGLISVMLSPPGDYLTLLRNIPKYTVDFKTHRMVSLRGLAYWLKMPALYYVFVALAGGWSIFAMRRLPLTEAFSVALVGSLVCAYHAAWYDYALLILPIAITLQRGARLPRFLAGVFRIGLPLWEWFPAPMAGLLAAYGVLLTRKRSEASILR